MINKFLDNLEIEYKALKQREEELKKQKEDYISQVVKDHSFKEYDGIEYNFSLGFDHISIHFIDSFEHEEGVMCIYFDSIPSIINKLQSIKDLLDKINKERK